MRAKVHELLADLHGAFEGFVKEKGEYSLACTEAHRRFQELYESKVDAELRNQGILRENLLQFLENGRDENEGVEYLLDMLLSLGDFEHFADLMLRRREGKRVTLPINLRDVNDVSDMIFSYKGPFGDEGEDTTARK